MIKEMRLTATLKTYLISHFIQYNLIAYAIYCTCSQRKAKTDLLQNYGKVTS